MLGAVWRGKDNTLALRNVSEVHENMHFGTRYYLQTCDTIGNMHCIFHMMHWRRNVLVSPKLENDTQMLEEALWQLDLETADSRWLSTSLTVYSHQVTIKTLSMNCVATVCEHQVMKHNLWSSDDSDTIYSGISQVFVEKWMRHNGGDTVHSLIFPLLIITPPVWFFFAFLQFVTAVAKCKTCWKGHKRSYG